MTTSCQLHYPKILPNDNNAGSTVIVTPQPLLQTLLDKGTNTHRALSCHFRYGIGAIPLTKQHSTSQILLSKPTILRSLTNSVSQPFYEPSQILLSKPTILRSFKQWHVMIYDHQSLKYNIVSFTHTFTLLITIALLHMKD